MYDYVVSDVVFCPAPRGPRAPESLVRTPLCSGLPPLDVGARARPLPSGWIGMKRRRACEPSIADALGTPVRHRAPTTQTPPPAGRALMAEVTGHGALEGPVIRSSCPPWKNSAMSVPAERAIVFSLDEKSQIQVIAPSQASLNAPARDYKRHGTTTLFAAPLATGHSGAPPQEFLA